MRLRMLPAVEPVYGLARGALFPVLRPGAAVDDRGCAPDPRARAGDPREQPRLVPRPVRARVPRRPPAPEGAVPRQGRAVRQARARRSCCGSCTRSRSSADDRRGRRRSTPRSTRCAAGECVCVFPEGTISLDLEPMAGKTGTARLAAASGVPVTPVGLWGAQRIMFKGRKPDWRSGRRGDGRRRRPRARRRPTRTSTTRPTGSWPRSPGASPGRAPSTRSARTRTTTGGGCGRRRRRCSPAARRSGRRRRSGAVGMRVAVVGAGSWGTAVAALCSRERRRRPVGPRPGARGVRLGPPREPRLPPGHRAAATPSAPPPTSPRRARAPTWS